MNVHYNYNYQRQPLNGATLLGKVKPNIRATHKKMQLIAILCACMIPVCMIIFITGGMGAVTAEEFGFPVQVIIGFVGFGVSGVLAGVFFAIAYQYKELVTLIMEVTAADKVNLDNLTLTMHIGKGSVIAVINKLIATKNLDGYEVIGDVGVAKSGTWAKPSDFGATPAKEVRTKCSACGAGITATSGKFCEFCGTLLK